MQKHTEIFYILNKNIWIYQISGTFYKISYKLYKISNEIYNESNKSILMIFAILDM